MCFASLFRGASGRRAGGRDAYRTHADRDMDYLWMETDGLEEDSDQEPPDDSDPAPEDGEE